MKAMVLAAGVGSRLDPLTRAIPKPLVPIVNKPVIAHILELLARHGVRDVLINLHYLGGAIRAALGDGARLGVRITYAEEEQLWGDAGSVKRNAEWFGDEPFLVIGGDDLSDIDITRLLRFHRDKKAVATLALSLVDDPSEYGIAMVNEHARITRFLEKPRGQVVFSNTANTGVYVFQPEVLELIPAHTFYGIGNNLLPFLLEHRRPVFGHLTGSYWRDVGNLEEYRQAHYDTLEGRVQVTIPLPEARRFVWIGEDVEIDSSAEIGYPVAIGNHCRIGPGARVVDNSVLGDYCVLHRGASLRKSILWDGATVGESTWLERCVVGHGCHVSSNAAVFNGVVMSPVGAD
jgi:mannose-1-phosphate guanylyltransferase/phosphomannomutase